jgi:hypothetical protein
MGEPEVERICRDAFVVVRNKTNHMYPY